MINKALAERLDLSEETIKEIEELQKRRHEYGLAVPCPTNEKEARAILNFCHDLEFQLQALWKFDPDINRHCFW